MSAESFDPDDGLLLPAGAEPVEPTGSGTKFRDLHHFVTEYLVVMWARAVRDTDTTHKWCPYWD